MEFAPRHCRHLLAALALWSTLSAGAAEPPKDNEVPGYMSLEQRMKEDEKAIAQLEHRLKRMRQHRRLLAERASRAEMYNRLALESSELPRLREQLSAQIAAVGAISREVQLTPALHDSLTEAEQLVDRLMKTTIEIDGIFERKTDSYTYLDQLSAAIRPLFAQVRQKSQWLARLERVGPVLKQFASRFSVPTTQESRILQGEVLEELMRLEREYAAETPISSETTLAEYLEILEGSYPEFERLISQLESHAAVDLNPLRPSLVRYFALTEYLAHHGSEMPTKPTARIIPNANLSDGTAILTFPIRGLIPYSQWGLGPLRSDLPLRERLKDERTLFYTLPVLILPLVGLALTQATEVTETSEFARGLASVMTYAPLLLHGSTTAVSVIVAFMFGGDDWFDEPSHRLKHYKNLRQQKRTIQLIQRLQAVLTPEALCSTLLK